MNDVTVTYVAKPQDKRCAWWSFVLPDELTLSSERIKATFLRAGADLELPVGAMLVDSESVHHTKNRGYLVRLGVTLGDGVKFIKPTMARKMYIKSHGGQDLMHESGDVAGCVRMAIWLRRQSELSVAFAELLAAQ